MQDTNQTSPKPARKALFWNAVFFFIPFIVVAIFIGMIILLLWLP